MMNFLYNITPTTYVIIGTIIIIIGLVVISIIFKDDLNGWYFNSIFLDFLCNISDMYKCFSIIQQWIVA